MFACFLCVFIQLKLIPLVNTISSILMKFEKCQIDKMREKSTISRPGIPNKAEAHTLWYRGEVLRFPPCIIL